MLNSYHWGMVDYNLLSRKVSVTLHQKGDSRLILGVNVHVCLKVQSHNMTITADSVSNTNTKLKLFAF